jgi:hypothetical protein
MKNFLLLALIFSLTGSCIKSDYTTETQNVKKIRSYENYQYGVDIKDEDIVKGLQDQEDEDLSLAILNLTKAMRPILQNQQLMGSLLTAVRNATNQELDLTVFAESNIQFTNIVNTELQQLVPNFASFNSSWQNYMNAKLTRQNTSYKPFLHIGNGAEVDYAQKAMLCAGLNISEVKMVEFDDHIPCWYETNGLINFTAINDEQSFQIQQPILIVDNGVGVPPTDFARSLPRVLDTDGKKIRTTSDKLDQTRFQINFAYEGSSKVDYTILSQVTEFWQLGGPNFIANNNAATASTIKVPQSKVGTVCNTPCEIITQACPYSGTPSLRYDPDRTTSGAKQAVCTYEYDWYASLKLYDPKFIQAGNSSTWLRRDLRMKFPGEYYHFEPHLYDGFLVGTLSSGVTHTITNKGFIDLVRTK